jgi:hypothetical protein
VSTSAGQGDLEAAANGPQGHRLSSRGFDTHTRFSQYRELPDRLSKGGMAMKHLCITPSWLRRMPVFGG